MTEPDEQAITPHQRPAPGPPHPAPPLPLPSPPPLPHIEKWTYLFDSVEVDGIVQGTDSSITGDVINLDVDEPLRSHLTAHVPGSDGSHAGYLHGETYPEGITSEVPRKGIPDHFSPWPLPRHRDADPYQVKDLDGNLRNLRGGDHIRVAGRILIENGHPGPGPRELCPWLELHPFDYTTLRIIDPSGMDDYTLALVAPLYSRVTYYGVRDDRSRVDGEMIRTVTETMVIPTLYAESWTEHVIENSTGLPVDEIRTITPDKANRQLRITATVTARGDYWWALYDQRAAFQAKYSFSGQVIDRPPRHGRQ